MEKSFIRGRYMKKTVIYIGNFFFPLGNAAGKRVYANGKILKELGYNVIFIGQDKENNDMKELRSTKKEYDGFTYYNFPYPQNNFEWMKYKTAYKELIKLLESQNIIEDLALIIYYGSSRFSLFNKLLINFCTTHNIKIVADSVDWLTTKTKNPIFDLVKLVHYNYLNIYLNKKTNGVITISKYLERHYKKQGCKTVILPPLSPINYGIPKLNSRCSDTKIITYAGLPFRKGQPVIDYNTLKDRIDKVIILLHQMKKVGCNFIFNIYGFTKEEYIQAIPGQKAYLDELGKSIAFHGHKQNEEVVNSIINSDFTILIRDLNRDTRAGFPTKVSESISCGTPVITTRTSDLEDYIVEGKNGFFLDFDNNNAVSYMKRILKMNIEEIEVMKKYCIKSQTFHYNNYISRMKEFLNKI